MPRPNNYNQENAESSDSSKVLSSCLIRSIKSKVKNEEIACESYLPESSGLASTSEETFQRFQDKYSKRKLQSLRFKCTSRHLVLQFKCLFPIFSVLRGCPNGLVAASMATILNI